LGQVADVVEKLFLFQGRKKEIRKVENRPYRSLFQSRITRANSWDDLARHLLF
jgi:hypothetical protein